MTPNSIIKYIGNISIQAVTRLTKDQLLELKRVLNVLNSWIDFCLKNRS